MTKIYIIAEAGINHNGDLNIAKQMILEAKQCGADCIKFQTFRANEFISDSNQLYSYKSQGVEVIEPMLDMFKRCEFNQDQWVKLIEVCNNVGIDFCSTAQNITDLNYLINIVDLPFIKVGSDDLTNLELLEYYSKQNKPMIISAGMAYAYEIEDAVRTIRNTGNSDITVLHCVSLYPANSEDINLSKIPIIKNAFGVNVGFSDHTIGSAAAIGAVCFGATVIEKHFTLDINLPGPDHWFSIPVSDLKKFVNDVRFIEKAIGYPQLMPSPNEIIMRNVMQRKIVYSKTLSKDDILRENDIEFKRTGSNGLDPKQKKFIIGRHLSRSVQQGEPVNLTDFI